MKKLFLNSHKSKTQWFNGSIVFIGLIQSNIDELRVAIPPIYFGSFLIAVGMVGWVLRTMTTQPIKDK